MTPLDVERTLAALQEGQLTLQGQFLWGSNDTLLVEVHHGDLALEAVYKPTRGERPLWDFPRGTLAAREVAAFLVSQALRWELVPPTVYRREGPLGPGSLQLFIEHDPEYHYFNFREADRQRLRPVVLFDTLINNADRKGSHLLIDPQGHLWLIDHGVCFHAQDKLRTVIWDFAGEPIPEALCADLARLRDQLTPPSALRLTLEAYLSPREVDALARRAARLLKTGRFPNPDPTVRPYPWPPV